MNDMHPKPRPAPQFQTGNANITAKQKYVEKQGDDTTSQSFLPDLSMYTLTAGEASAIMQQQRCRHHSMRKVQRLCQDGAIDCWKLKTTRQGQPVSEWLVNELSLVKRIADHEPKLDAGVANPPPEPTGNASTDENPIKMPTVRVTPNNSGDARQTTEKIENVEEEGDDIVPPKPSGVANGETRTLASALIENAKLTAELDGSRELVNEMRDDKKFLRVQFVDALKRSEDVTNIAEKMLETMETIALGGKFLKSKKSKPDEKQNSVPATPSFREHPEQGVDIKEPQTRDFGV